MMKTKEKQWTVSLMTILLLYCIGYGLARWRKCIVMRETIIKEEFVLVRQTGYGRDVRDNWKGRLKNTVNPIVFIIFRPLAAIEDAARGFRKPLDRTTQS